jgi:hypothetical protein
LTADILDFWKVSTKRRKYEMNWTNQKKEAIPWTAPPTMNLRSKKQQQGRQKKRKSITYSAEFADLKFQKPTIIKLQLSRRRLHTLCY